MQLFYTNDLSGDIVQLAREESIHCVRTLRMRRGDKIELTDGCGTRAEGEVLVADAAACTVHIASRTFMGARADYRLHLAVAPTKNADRIEWLVEKAVEIGIDEITPLITHNTERTRLNRDRLQKIAVSAMKQSLHNHLPAINAETPFGDFVARDYEAVKIICHGHYERPLTLAQACPAKRDAVVVVGPEGDFTPDEVAMADRCGFLPVTLGRSRLRTETAALMTVCAMSLING